MPPMALGLGLGLSRVSRPPPLILDFRSSSWGFGTEAPTGCGYARAACASSVQTGASTLFDLSALSAVANVIVSGRASDSWEIGVALEEARTNRLPYSRDFAQQGAGKWLDHPTSAQITRTAGQSDPAGDTGATTVAVTAADYGLVEFSIAAISGAAAVSFSLWAKNGAPNLSLYRASAGRLGSTASAGASWARLSISGAVGVGEGVAVGLVDGRDWSAIGGYGSGARTATVYGAQLEAGAYPTSYIPTAGAAATRNANFLPVLGATWASRILAGRVGLELWLRPMGARAEYTGTRYLWWIDSNNNVAFDASTGVITVTIAGASNTTSAITWSRYADVKVYVELGGSLATYVAVLIDGVRTVPTITGSALGTLAAGDLYLRSSSTTGSTCAWVYTQSFWSPGTRPSWAA